MLSMVCPALVSLLAISCSQAQGDLVVHIAEDQPVLFRMIGDRVVPFGTARFSRPASLVADPNAGVVYVLDRPAPGTGGRGRLWRIGADGSGAVVARPQIGSTAPALGLDGAGRVLLFGCGGALDRLEPDGTFTSLLGPLAGELDYLSCGTAAPGGGLFAASGYVVGQHGLETQGALVHLDGSRVPAAAQPLITNREPGQPKHDTFWRAPTQLLVDGAGRLLLVDAGDEASDILGGILCRHPDGRLQDLTFATPDGRARPMRHPTGIAPWTRDAWLVADPRMYVGPGGTGGLFVLGADGSRTRWWRFGPRCRPFGVAVLRGVAPPPPPPPRPFASYVGAHTGGQPRVIGAQGLKIESTGMTVAGQYIVTGNKETPLTPAAAAAQVARHVTGASWIIGPSGSLVFAAAGADPAMEGPLVCRGTADLYHHALIFTTTSRGRTRTDPDKSFIRGALVPLGGDAFEVHAFYKCAHQGILEGEFVQTVRIPGAAAAAVPAPDPTGGYVAGEPDAFSFLWWTRQEVAGEPGSPSYGLYVEKRPIPQPQAAAGVQDMLRGATWQIAADGQIEVRAPLGRIAGTVARVGDELVLSLRRLGGKDLWCHLPGRLERGPDGGLVAWLALDYAWEEQHVRAEFRQVLRRQ